MLQSTFNDKRLCFAASIYHLLESQQKLLIVDCNMALMEISIYNTDHHVIPPWNESCYQPLIKEHSWRENRTCNGSLAGITDRCLQQAY